MTERGWRVAAAAVVVAAVGLGGLVAWAGRPGVPPAGVDAATSAPPGAGPGSAAGGSIPQRVADEDDEPAHDGGGITVHVTGEVTRPGLVRLATGARVADAVAAAGGLTPGAAREVVNLAAPLVDGTQVVIPATGAAPATAGDAGDGLVHVNQADASVLQTLPGVGPVLAERLVEHREAHGPFVAVEDLLAVPGIGESKLASLRDHVAIP